jgi:hypothetical protein
MVIFLWFQFFGATGLVADCAHVAAWYYLIRLDFDIRNDLLLFYEFTFISSATSAPSKTKLCAHCFRPELPWLR